MKIVHIANFYGPNSGGIKTTLHALGKGYLRLGHEFIYIVPGTSSYQEQTPFGLKISVPGFVLPGTGGYQIIKSNRHLRTLIADLQPDFLEVSDRFTLMSLGKWARERKIPTTVFSHETLAGLAGRFLPLPHKMRTALVRWHNRKLSRSFDQVVTTTDFAAQEFHEIGAPNIYKISLGVDLEIFNPNKRSESMRRTLLHGNSVLLVHCGRLSREKDPARSIETLIELRRQGVDARLIIIGMGPMWKELRALAEGHPVEMLGYITDRNRIAEIIACADVSFAPGPFETFCLSALESLACGTPVVASESSAVKEMLYVKDLIPAGAIAADNFECYASATKMLLGISSIRTAARIAAEKLPWTNSINLMRELHGLSEIGKNAPHAIVRSKNRAA
jgi:alpha-1,6-mannosyltransferase